MSSTTSTASAVGSTVELYFTRRPRHSPRMWAFLRKQALYFLVGFVLCFVVYLFVRFNADAVILGLALSVVAGLIFSFALWWAERRFDNPRPPQQGV